MITFNLICIYLCEILKHRKLTISLGSSLKAEAPNPESKDFFIFFFFFIGGGSGVHLKKYFKALINIRLLYCVINLYISNNVRKLKKKKNRFF